MHQDWGPLIVDTGRYDAKKVKTDTLPASERMQMCYRQSQFTSVNLQFSVVCKKKTSLNYTFLGFGIRI